VGAVGYLFGSALAMIIGDLKGLENYLLGGIAVIGGMFGIFQLLSYRIIKDRKTKRVCR